MNVTFDLGNQEGNQEFTWNRAGKKPVVALVAIAAYILLSCSSLQSSPESRGLDLPYEVEALRRAEIKH